MPLFGDLVTKPIDRQALQLMLAPAEIGRPIFGPPGIPVDRVAALRKAFDQSLKDEDLIKDARTQRLDISPVNGQDMEALIVKAYQSPQEVVARARELVAAGGPN